MITGIIFFLSFKSNFALLNPKGYIAYQQFRLLIFATTLMLSVAIPTLMILYFFAWKYRDTNPKNYFDPSVTHRTGFFVGLWTIPIIIISILILVMFSSTKQLDQRKPIVSTNEKITIQVIALRWKWLFIYPDQKIASVNFVQVPVNTPVEFVLTADETPMSSFWVPQISGQLYAMTGHVNKINMMADSIGDFNGGSAELNGPGFAGMNFVLRSSSQDNFNKWVKNVQAIDSMLDADNYHNLVQPTENNAVAYYKFSNFQAYSSALQKYSGSHNHIKDSE